MEGHGAGLCLSMAAHVSALFCGAVLVEDAEAQTDAATTVDIINIQVTPAAPTVVDTGTQVTPIADDERSTSMKNVDMMLHVNFSTQATPETTETATQTFVEHPNTPPNIACHRQHSPHQCC
jgi:hypothetical protein